MSKSTFQKTVVNATLIVILCLVAYYVLNFIDQVYTIKSIPEKHRFHYYDEVEFINGFYKGHTGIVHSMTQHGYYIDIKHGTSVQTVVISHDTSFVKKVEK